MRTDNQTHAARNSKMHDTLSGALVLECESQDRFLELHAAMIEEFQPRSSFEEALVENITVARWRQMRIWAMERAAMDQQIRKQARQARPGDDNAAHATTAFRTLGDESRSLDLINRFESRYDRQFYRAHRRLLEVRDRRTPPPEQHKCRRRRPDPAQNELTPATTPVIDNSVAAENDFCDKRTQQVTENKPAPSAQNTRNAGDQPCLSYTRPDPCIIASQPVSESTGAAVQEAYDQ